MKNKETANSIDLLNIEESNLKYKETWEFKVSFYANEELYRPILNWRNHNKIKNRIQIAKEVLISFWNIDNFEKEIVITSNDYRQADTVLRILHIIQMHYEDRSFQSLSRSDLEKIATLFIFYVWDKSSDEYSLIKVEKPLSRQVFERGLSVLKKWFNCFQLGNCPDGPDFYLKGKLIERNLKALGIDFYRWNKGGSYGKIPFHISNLLLSDAIETLKSIKTQQLLAYFKTVYDLNAHDSISGFWVIHKSAIYNYRKSGDIEELKKTKKSTSDRANFIKYNFTIALDERLRKISHNKESFTFPWIRHEKLISDYNNLQGALYIILLSVMGKRGPSEVRTLRGVDISRPNKTKGLNASFFPRISKTNQGLRLDNGVTNFIDECFEVLLNLGYQNKEGTEMPLFSSLQKANKAEEQPRLLSIDRSDKRLKDYYDSFCDRYKSKFSFEIFDQHQSISSHQFRHSWAEFALRKFDSNVEEMIRQHFCHSYNHWWTKRYTEDKLDSSVTNEINRSYIKELIPRIIFDSSEDPDFVGAIALYIKKNESKNIKTLPPKEAEDEIEKICDEFITITPHEYGFCLLSNKFESVANCRDKNNKVEPENTTSSKCTSCSNFCASRKSHKKIQERILISHLDFIEQKIWKSEKLKSHSIKAVKSIQKLFPEFEEYGEVN